MLDAIDVLVNQAIKDKSTQIYSGVCKSVVDASICVMTINGKDNSVKFYGASPMVGNVYRVFIPSGNMSMAFIITTSGEATSAVTSVNGKTGNVNLTANDIGAAPAGYGLGVGSKSISESDDINNVWENGWYQWAAPPANAPFSYGTMLVANEGGGYIMHQLIISVDGYLVIRNKAGEWKQDEWVNPPMYIGAEYRTTELYKGKPVYVKLVDFGAIPTKGTTKSVAHGISNVANVIQVYGTTSAGFVIPYGYTGDRIYMGANKTHIQIENAVSNFDASLYSAYVTVKYTKTTD